MQITVNIATAILLDHVRMRRADFSGEAANVCAVFVASAVKSDIILRAVAERPEIYRPRRTCNAIHTQCAKTGYT